MNTTPDSRCTLVGLSMEDPAASARDPALALLVERGWWPMASLPAQGKDGAQQWLLLMAPPRPQALQAPLWQPLLRVAVLLLALQLAASLGLLAALLVAR